MIITQQQFSIICPLQRKPEIWVNALNEILPKYKIDTPVRVAAFLAQCGHESLDFTVLVENLNYSASGLHKVFKKYFPTLESAEPYQRKPEMIANLVYAKRMGNGDVKSGDGYKFRGRGAIQLTGKDNYIQFSQFLYKDNRLLDNPDYLLTPEGAILSACWFWTVNNLNAIADKENILELTKRINGGTNGIEDRMIRYKKAISVLKPS